MKKIEYVIDKFYEIVDKIGKHNVMLISFIAIVLVITGLYSTFSIRTSLDGSEVVDGVTTYKFILNSSLSVNTVVIPANSEKNLDVIVTNDDDATLKYGLYYSATGTINIGTMSVSTKEATDVVDGNSVSIVSLKVVNDNASDVTVTLGLAYGFENGGSLTLPSGKSWIENFVVSANAPNLDNGNLIPVYYDGDLDVWRKADSSNEDNSWYDYDNKKWANAIIKSPDVVTDLSYNQNNGKVVGASWDKKGGMVTTDGVDDYVDLGLVSYDFGSDASLVSRVKFNNSGVRQNFLGNWEAGGIGFFVNSSNKLVFEVYVGGAYNSAVTDYIITPGSWYTFVGTYNGTNLVVYVNGTKVLTHTITTGGNIGVSTAPFGIAVNPRPTSVGEEFSSITVSDVLIFDRVLSESEVTSNYVDVPNPVDETDLLLHYDFSDGDDIPIDTIMGETLDEGTIGFYTWIPRFKYRVWNITRQGGAESTYAYPAYTNGIDIKWEMYASSSGNVECTYNTATVNSATNLSDVCVYNGTDTITTTSGNSNYTDAWYTHPAFTFNNSEKEGFWIGKFDTTGGGTGGTEWTNPTILPDRSPLVSMTLSAQFTSARVFQKYVSNNVNAHMLTNLEWGAVAYLTHSLYGLCDENSCRDIYINNSNMHYTGRSAGVLAPSSTVLESGNYDYKGYSMVDSSAARDESKVASTTGNITGVYDMVGGSMDYVMGNMVNSSNDFNVASAGTDWNGSTTLSSFYYNAYSYGTSSGQLAFNISRLGDATGEVASGDGLFKSWRPGVAIDGAASYFIDAESPWFGRGGFFNNTDGGSFYYVDYMGAAAQDFSFRVGIS